MYKSLLIGLLLAFFCCNVANAQTCATIPYTFSSGTTASSSQVNSNFTSVRNCANTLASGGTINNLTLTGTTHFPSGIITSAGAVGIGTTSPGTGYGLTVANGSFQTSGTSNNIISGGYVGWYSSATAPSSQDLCYNYGYIYYTGICTSLSQYKKNQRTLSLGLDTLMQLHPVEFDWDEQHGGRHDLGFIAQEVEKVAPLLAQYDYKDDPKGKLISVKYGPMTSLITKSVQQLKGIVDAQAAQISSQTAEIARLSALNVAQAAELKQAKQTNANIEVRVSRLESAIVTQPSKQAANVGVKPSGQLAEASYH